MKVETRKVGAVTVIAPSGPVSGDEDVGALRSHVEGAVKQSFGRMVIDLSKTAFIDSHGLELLLDTSESLGESGHALKLCGLGETLREVLDLTDVLPLVECFEDANAAARSFM